MKIDEYFPKYDFIERHQIKVKCTPHEAYETLKKIDLTDSITIRFLFWLRGLKSGKFQKLQERFSLIYNEPDKEILLGLIARPWQIKGGILHLSKEDFQKFNESNSVKIVWNFAFEQQNDEKMTTVSTETRILCMDEKSKKKFRIYWFFIRPFSGWVRIEILKLLRKNLDL